MTLSFGIVSLPDHHLPVAIKPHQYKNQDGEREQRRTAITEQW